MTDRKMSKDLAKEISSNVLKHAFLDEVQEVVECNQRFAEFIFENALGSDLKKFKDIPENWFDRATGFRCKFGDISTGLEFSGRPFPDLRFRVVFDRVQWAPEVKHLYVPYSMKYKCVKVYDCNSSETDQFLSIRDQFLNIRRRVIDTHKELHAIILSASTVEKLLDKWPAIKPFAEPLLAEQKPNDKVYFPANLIQLEKTLGIDVEKETEN